MRFIAVGVPPVAGLETVDPLASLDEWVTRVADRSPDAVFLAELLPHWSGREAAVALARRAPSIPVIGVVKPNDVAGAIRWFQVGATDVVELPVVRFERVDRSARAPPSAWSRGSNSAGRRARSRSFPTRRSRAPCSWPTGWWCRR